MSRTSYQQQVAALIKEGLTTLTTDPIETPIFSKKLRQIARERRLNLVSNGGWNFFEFSDRLLRRLKTLARKGVIVLNRPEGRRSYVVSLPK